LHPSAWTKPSSQESSYLSTESKRPWRLYQNYALDIVSLRLGKVDDGVMRYS
jgi:hypothetical protein